MVRGPFPVRGRARRCNAIARAGVAQLTTWISMMPSSIGLMNGPAPPTKYSIHPSPKLYQPGSASCGTVTR